MSLSNYYENSSSFQPEELVKPGGSGPTSSWIPLPRSDNRPFATRSLLSDKGLPTGPALQELPQPVPAPPPADPKVLEPSSTLEVSPEPPLPVTEAMDLSNHIELAVAERQMAEAYREGFEKGREEERRRAEEDFASAGRALLLSCQQLDTLRDTIIANSNREIVDFTLAIAEKIVRNLVQEQDATIVATIEEALRRAVKSEEFTIFLHPDDYSAVAAKAGDIVAGVSGLNNIVLRKDKSIERGGAKIESDNCTIDATITGQFDLIREEVRKRL